MDSKYLKSMNSPPLSKKNYFNFSDTQLKTYYVHTLPLFVMIGCNLPPTWFGNVWFTTSVNVDYNNVLVRVFTVSRVVLVANWPVISFHCLFDSEDVTLVKDWPV